MMAPPQTITVENQDPNALVIEDVSTTPAGALPLSSTQFKIVGGSCHPGESIEPGKTCTIEVAMAPTTSGLLQSRLEVTDNAPDSPQSVALEGIATPPTPNGQPPAPAAEAAPPASASPVRTRRTCRKGKRSAVRKGHRICVRNRKHHRRR
jgi:hypothetical protein